MRVLITDIVTGERKTGDDLLREQDLAAEFAVSRGVARECIRAMEERGLISVKHGKGATINDSDSWDMFDPDVLEAMLDSNRGIEVLTQYVECRQILEVEAAGLAAQRATKADLERMADALASMEETSKRPPNRKAEDQFHEADLAFHQALIAATRNRALANLVEPIHAALLAARYPLARPQYRTERAMPEHKRILAAVASGDPKAAKRAMSAHLDTVAGYLQEYADSLESPAKA
jgi:DNA-binding FadR family transcriptional regulator